ncbi:MAG: CDP-alcohol phosphatidyltransferase family protein [Acidobacteriaceae bacterium]
MAFLSQFRAAPNLLTLLRLFIIPFLVIEITDGQYRVAFALFLLAGISDAMDGLLARWLRQHTRLGQYLDPIADKLMLSTLFVTLTHVGMIPRYVTVLVFSRDLGILLIATLLFATGTLRDFRPSLLGKLNTVMQILALVAVMCERVFAATATSHGLVMVRDGLLRLIAVLAPLSAAQYAWIVIRRINAPPTPAAPAV